VVASTLADWLVFEGNTTPIDPIPLVVFSLPALFFASSLLSRWRCNWHRYTDALLVLGTVCAPVGAGGSLLLAINNGFKSGSNGMACYAGGVGPACADGGAQILAFLVYLACIGLGVIVMISKVVLGVRRVKESGQLGHFYRCQVGHASLR